MSRYRKIEVKMWGDAKFRSLSTLPPCGQGLWLYLLTGPNTGPIPGLFRAGRAAMAEELDWDVKAFDKAFAEVLEKGMVKSDFKARVVWVPKAIFHNRPVSPNVVKSWGKEWEMIPECDLKTEAFHSLRTAMYSFGESFGKVFDEAFVMPSEPLLIPELKPDTDPTCEEPGQVPVKPDSPIVISLPLNDKSEHTVTEADVAQYSSLFPAVDVVQELRNMAAWCLGNPTKLKTSRGIVKFITGWLARVQNKGGSHGNGNNCTNPPGNGRPQVGRSAPIGGAGDFAGDFPVGSDDW